MYLVRVDGRVYERRGGGTFTLVEAMRELWGTRNAYVLREDGTVVVRNAGSTVNPWTHVPTGRVIRHRLTRWGRERYEQMMREQNARRQDAWRAERAAQVAA